jgi:hypothetical protein
MELLNFKDFITEDTEPQHHHVLAFGRMNPPTTGHMAVINKVHEVSHKHKAEHTVVASHSQDNKKNPLSPTQKVKHLKRFSPNTNFKTSSEKHPTILHHASELHKKGVTHLHVVVGSDRKKEMHTLLHKYNGKDSGHGHYNFKKITVHSAGQRDPDAEGTSGVSGTLQRHHAKTGNYTQFRKGVPPHVSDKHTKELMHDVQHGSKQ